MSEVSFTVNGTEVTLYVEPRLTLADALRHGLGLTGTHLGCEHGVCGACTVLVDGAATRSCLMFCVQADGAEVTTVEALGSPDDLHPLQEAFRRHHGLQCGFCTPGFLMSAYELLRDGADGLDDDRRLRQELSGVLCRCTGYAGIVEAIRDVAAAYPDGLPGPERLGRPLTVRGAAAAPGDERALQAASAEAPPVASAEAVDLSVPTGPPNETIDVTTKISPSPEETWSLLRDFLRMSRCLPGVELEGEEGEDTYRGRVQVRLGPMRLHFAGAARVLDCDDSGRTLRAVAAGRDASGGGVRAELTVGAESAENGTALRAGAKLYLTGRAAQFGRSIAGDVSRQLFAEFGDCVERTLTTGETVEPRKLGAGGMARRLLWTRVREMLRRLLGARNHG